ncbi:hypothetical protein FRC00_005742 [Tulasnella sp. 408]|nr:hypothetical protein FRC00_005742 [Tulasnella sp. 408]
MTTRTPEKTTQIPDLPREFGDDGGHFYRCYDELAEKSDENLVKNLKAQLDGILIFAGLFAGVNSTFLVFTLPQLSANPADDTNALLLQIALGINSNITSKADLPSASFLPSPSIYLVNVLFSVSLMLALFSSLLAVLGQQWIVYYRKRGGGGAENQRWEQLRRYLGAKRWRLEFVLDDLVPSLLQLGLVMFCIAFATHVGTLSQALNRVIVRLLYVAAATILAMATCAALDPWCPFKQPLSRIARPVASAVLVSFACSVYYSVLLFILLRTRIVHAIWPHVPVNTLYVRYGFLKLVKMAIVDVGHYYRQFLFAGIRSSEDPGGLKIEALRRVICTSEDRDALIHAAVNLQVLRDERALSSLAKHPEFGLLLFQLQDAAMREAEHGGSSNRSSLVQSKVLTASYLHFMISTCLDPYINGFGRALRIQVTSMTVIFSEQMSHLEDGSILALKTSCDEFSHRMTLLFSIRVAYIILESAKNRSLPDLRAAVGSVLETSAGNHDLRLGFIMVSLMIFRTQSGDEGWDDPNYRPQNEFLRTLFTAYRETSERKMFETISEALTTASARWRGKPYHEIYVWLFELCLLPGREEIYKVYQQAVLKYVGNHLLSLENWIREEGASGIKRQHGRDYQNRYVQAVAGFFADKNYSSLEAWIRISIPMVRYLRSVKELMENRSDHPENRKTMDLILRMESAFARPQSVGASAIDANLEQSTVSSNFRQLLDGIGLSIPAKALVSTQENGLQVATGHDDGKRVGLPEIVYDMWGN